MTSTLKLDAVTGGDDATLIDHTGWIYWPIAFIARLPFAMMTVGVLMLVVAATGSVGLGGLTSAAVGIGVVIAGPLIGDLVDRHGEAVVLPVHDVVHVQPEVTRAARDPAGEVALQDEPADPTGDVP